MENHESLFEKFREKNSEVIFRLSGGLPKRISYTNAERISAGENR